MEGREISCLDDERKSYKYLTPETEWSQRSWREQSSQLAQAMAPKRVQSRTSKRDTPDILSAAILKVRRGRGFFNMSVLAFIFSRFLRLEP